MGFSHRTEALTGIRVIDAATMVAGPLGASLLADFGADVIKVEPIDGDESRTFGPGRDGMSGVYSGVNRNKRALALDLRTAAGRELFHELCATADVLIENMLPAVRERFGLTAEQLRERHPHLICLNVSGYGDSGPLAGRPAMDPVAQALTGFMEATGVPGGMPVKAGPPVADSAAGYLVALAALVALFAKQRTGEGQSGSVSLVGALFHLQTPWLGQYLLADYVQAKAGNGSNFYAPYNAYATRDGGAVHVVAFNDRHFGKLARAIGAGELLDDPRFAAAADRLANREALDTALAPWFAEHDRDDVVALLCAHDIICAPILDYREAVDHPQIRALDLVVDITHDELGPLRVPGLPVKLSGTPGRVHRPPTSLGEHTTEILGDLGCRNDRIEALRADGVVR
ncbi:CaiB/BaiF CoA-transferase family protein [Nocardia sp. BMG111209]|uniref:CaiB/BaiF CoA transferase family protein n=1 Tax=Nocardia sp. BMG111209 TaxID=1160137 RepID=UPI00036B693C|nr:CoA transferase [Nocardia sp. BMG111209]